MYGRPPLGTAVALSCPAVAGWAAAVACCAGSLPMLSCCLHSACRDATLPYLCSGVCQGVPCDTVNVTVAIPAGPTLLLFPSGATSLSQGVSANATVYLQYGAVRASAISQPGLPTPAACLPALCLSLHLTLLAHLSAGGATVAAALRLLHKPVQLCGCGRGCNRRGHLLQDHGHGNHTLRRECNHHAMRALLGGSGHGRQLPAGNLCLAVCRCGAATVCPVCHSSPLSLHFITLASYCLRCQH